MDIDLKTVGEGLAVGYAGLQLVANGILLIMGEKRNHTQFYKFLKLIVSGPRRAP